MGNEEEDKNIRFLSSFNHRQHEALKITSNWRSYSMHTKLLRIEPKFRDLGWSWKSRWHIRLLVCRLCLMIKVSHWISH
jgi:Flp pilus assembly protein TadB